MLLTPPLLESRDFTRTPLTLQSHSVTKTQTRLRTTLFYPVQSFAHYHNGFGNDPKTSCCRNVFFNELLADCVLSINCEYNLIRLTRT